LRVRVFIRSSILASCAISILVGSARAAHAQANAPLNLVPQPVVAGAQAKPIAEEKSPLESGPRLVWNPKWPRFRAVGYALTAASVAGALAVTFLIPYPDDPRWVGGILADSAVRDTLRARTRSVRDAVRTASDYTLIASLLQTAVIDGFLIPATDGSWEVAWQLSLMNAQALALNTLVATLLFKAAARARPAFADCSKDRNFDPLCDSGSFASFPSSHTSTSFTAAGLTCIHHAHIPLYGGQPWDSAACAGSIVLASATGLFRIVGDRHYLSDVVLGAAWGFSLGYFYPYLFHYQYDDDGDTSSSSPTAMWGFVPGAQQSPYGVSVIGLF
jgi:membrane-associated phospholipid phosphatase